MVVIGPEASLLLIENSLIPSGLSQCNTVLECCDCVFGAEWMCESVTQLGHASGHGTPSQDLSQNRGLQGRCALVDGYFKVDGHMATSYERTDTAQEASWERVFDSVFTLLFDLYH